jgi:hypothetical protein
MVPAGKGNSDIVVAPAQDAELARERAKGVGR